MLGIALVVLLGFSLYHYRPRKLDDDNRFREALCWSEWGKRFSLGQPMFLFGITSVDLIHIVLRGIFEGFTYFNIFLYPFDFIFLYPHNLLSSLYATLFGLSVFLPLLFAFMTHRKLVKPLSEEKVPRQKGLHSLFVIGLFFMTFIEALAVLLVSYKPFGYPSGYGFEMMLLDVLNALPFFFGLTIGVLAVGIAEHKLRKLRIDLA